MPDTAQQSLFCAWETFEIWGVVKGDEIIHLSFDQERHRAIYATEKMEAVSASQQQEVCTYLRSLLQGAATAFPSSSPLICNGTPFQQRVWRALSHIPFASTKTYGDIAKELGNSRLARAVGQACNRNPLPLIIPCHRVVSSTGLGGFAGGSKVKEALLAFEQAWVKDKGEK